ncbi:kinase-like domain-containing protein, partial [Dunaliella salina]
SRIRHPNIVKFYGGCLHPPTVFIVEELMEKDLSSLVHGSDMLLALDDVLRIGRDIANGLFHLHPTIVHRDLKPANVLLDKKGEAALVLLACVGPGRQLGKLTAYLPIFCGFLVGSIEGTSHVVDLHPRKEMIKQYKRRG